MNSSDLSVEGEEKWRGYVNTFVLRYHTEGVTRHHEETEAVYLKR